MMFKTKPFACALALLVSVPTVSCDGMMSTASTYEDARSAFENGEYRIANAHLLDIIERGEAGPEVRMLQLELMLKMGDGNRAMVALDQIPESELAGAERRVAKAHAHILQGRPSKAVSQYETLAPEAYTEQDFRMALWALRDLDQIQDFTAGMDVALDRFPDSPHLNALAADQLFDMAMPESADRFVELALEKGSEIFEVQLVAGRRGIFARDVEKAIEHYQRAHEINKVSVLPLVNIAGLYLDLERPDDAKPLFDQALQINGDFPALHWQLARYKFATGDIQGAREARDRVIRDFSDQPEFIILSGQIEEELGNTRLALDAYRRFVREYGEVPEVMERIADLEG